MNTIIAAFDLYRFYHTSEEETLALRGVSLAIAPTEMVAVMGASGSGKSTLLNCLAGLDEPDGGYVALGYHRLTRQPEFYRSALRARNIGILLQSGNLFEYLTVEDNMRLQMHLAKKRDEKRLSMLIRATGLTHRRTAYSSQLSGGETARAGLAVALAANPIVLIADEPTAEVDAETEAQILDLLQQHCQSGNAAIIATHSSALAQRADRIVSLVDGKVTSG